MKYSSPKLYSFGNDVKHGADCISGSANKPSCASGSSDTSASNTCNTGGTACSCYTTGNKPGSWCGTGNAVTGHSCYSGNGAKPSPDPN